MSEVTMVKGSETISVNSGCVAAHKKAGWSIATDGQENIAQALSALPEVQSVVRKMEDRLSEMETRVLDLQDEVAAQETQIKVQDAKIQELTVDVELASGDEAPDAAEVSDLASRIAALEAKKSAGQMEKQDYPLLARLTKRLASLQA